jgi:hypothetical protein
MCSPRGHGRQDCVNISKNPMRSSSLTRGLLLFGPVSMQASLFPPRGFAGFNPEQQNVFYTACLRPESPWMCSDCLALPLFSLCLNLLACQVHYKNTRKARGESTVLPAVSVGPLVSFQCAPCVGTCNPNHNTNSLVPSTPPAIGYYVYQYGCGTISIPALLVTNSTDFGHPR